MDEGSNKDRLLAEQVRAFEGDKPGPPTRREPVQLMLDLDGFEGPIDVLLTLARDQKVDIARLSVTQLADQYLAFIAQARAMRLELAADYLVMAAWLAYLKSRLLLPEAPDDGEPSGPELAEALTFKLRRLEAMREAADALTRRPRLGRDRFARGMPEGIRVEVRAVYLTGLFDLLKAYGNVRARQEGAALTVTASTLMSPEQALERLTRMLAVAPMRWNDLATYLPDDISDGLLRRSTLASTFVAALELARQNKVELKQDRLFGPLMLRPRRGEAAGGEGRGGAGGGDD